MLVDEERAGAAPRAGGRLQCCRPKVGRSGGPLPAETHLHGLF